ncbi:Type IV conjugative transfer system coupling protein TraD [Vibrio chagasii]|nr:Type IV conjugative transfer system coupling protein TraD [Vibrio chagasii]CAH7132521.1 Type IV conjugative transfer system coupling protein TraD [Vibrio chagasii]
MRTRNKSNNFTRGGQVTFHSIRMFFQVNNILIKFIGCGVIVATLTMTWWDSPPNAFWGEFYYWRNIIYAKLGKPLGTIVTTTWDGTNYKATLASQLQNNMLLEIHKHVWKSFQVYYLISMSIGLFVFYLMQHFFKKLGEKQSNDFHVRGFRRVSPTEFTKTQIKRAKANRKRGYGNGSISSFKIDGQALLKQSFEVQHLLINGTTGSGKSVMVLKLMSWIRKRGDQAIIYDKGGALTRKFYHPQTDIILNPFDNRCANWNVWCDAKEKSDFDKIAEGLIPKKDDGAQLWIDAARIIFSSIAYRMSQDNEPITTARLLRLILTCGQETLENTLEGTEAASVLRQSSEKDIVFIKSVLATYIKSMCFLDGLDDEERELALRTPFSITDWITDHGKSGFVFLSSNTEQHSSLRPLISMWLTIASKAILGLEADKNRRVWIIIDEISSLHKLPELGSIITEVRSFGGCFLIGIQSYAQLVNTYGKNSADEVFDSLNTRFFFRSPSEQMAKVASQDLGEQEVDISKENISYGANILRDGVSLGHQTVTRPVVSPGEIQALDDLQCFMRTPGVDLICKLNLKLELIKDICSPYEKRCLDLSQPMKDIHTHATYCETAAPKLYLSKHEQKTNFDTQYSNFDSSSEGRTKSMQVQPIQAQIESAYKANLEYQEQARLIIDEQSISSEID